MVMLLSAKCNMMSMEITIDAGKILSITIAIVSIEREKEKAGEIMELKNLEMIM